jgi:hypothetical protein
MIRSRIGTTEFAQIRYGVALWLLQEKAGLSYKEARVFLAHSRHETTEHLMESLGISRNTIYGLRRSAKKKVEKCNPAPDLSDLLHGYVPIVLETNIRVGNPPPLF